MLSLMDSVDSSVVVELTASVIWFISSSYVLHSCQLSTVPEFLPVSQKGPENQL